jgi:uncharacterized protein (TIGR03067 family)
MTRLGCLCAGLALVLSARPCLAEPTEEERARLRAEIARLRQENAALKKQLEALAPPQSDFQGVLRERTVNLLMAPGVSSPGFRQEPRLVIDLGNFVSYDLAFKEREEEQKARSWRGRTALVRGSVQMVPGNPWAREMMFPPPSFPIPARFSTFKLDLNPPGRWVLAVENWSPVEGKEDQANLQGTWRVVGLIAEGTRFEAASRSLKDTRLVMSGNRAAFTGNHVTLVGPVRKEKEKSFEFALDHSTRPGTIQFTNNKEVLRGIFQFKGDDLQLCFPRDEEARMPTDFTATPGSKRWLYLLSRERPDQERGKKK